jgi:hypothetical protein
MTEHPPTLAASLALLQTKLPVIHKGETATVKSQRTGQTFSYKYANLADFTATVLPLMGGCGLAFLAKPTLREDGRFMLVYKLLHTSGEAEEGAYPLPSEGSPQEIGSAITYARRYALCCVTGVAADEDDDGAAATRAHEQSQRRAKPRQRQQQEPEPSPPAEPPNAESAPTVADQPESAEHVDAWMLDFTDRVANAPDVATLRGPLYHEMVSKVTTGWITAVEGQDLSAQMAAVAERLERDRVAREAGAA